MFRIVQNQEDLLKVMMVRAIVFMEEQHVPYCMEVDEHEFSTVHVLGEIDGEPVATGRIRFEPGFAMLQRLAIRRAWRGNGSGRNLIEFMISQAKQRGFNRFELHAQTQAQGFYEINGFRADGDPFMEAGIEHIAMIRED